MASQEPAPRRDRSSVAVLVAANLLPVVGVAFWGWQVQDIVFLYWIENLIIGAFNVPRMAMAAGIRDKSGQLVTGLPAMVMKGFTVPFFVVHYGGFCFGHGVFLAALFPPGGAKMGELDLDAALLGVLGTPTLLAGALVLLASHGYSFFHNYIGGRQYLSAELDKQMFQPYKRIVVVHLFILAGGFLMTMFTLPVLAVVLFIALKTAIDGWSHQREQAGAKPG